MKGNRWRAGTMAAEFAANKHIPAIIELNCMQITQCNKEQSMNFIYLFIWTRELDHLNKMTALIWSKP